MNQSRFTRLLLQPSTNGLIGITGLSFAVMFISGFSYASRNGLLYEYLFGANSSVAFIETSRSTIAVLNETVFGNSALNKILFFAFWMVIGLIVYVILSGVGAGVSSAEHTVEETRYVHAQKLKMGSELGLKVVLRFIALGLGLMYIVLMYKVLIPFGILCARITTGDLGKPINWLYGFLGFIVLCGSFYLGLVLLRFLMLRPRVFGDWEDIIEDELQHNANLDDDSAA